MSSALLDLERMKARLAEIDSEREPLLALIKAGEAYEAVVGRTLFASGNPSIRQRPRPEGAGRAAPVMEATERTVKEALDSFGPMTTGDLVNLVGDRPELRLSSETSVNVLSARLSVSEKFQSRRGVGWWFADRNWPDEIAGRDDPEDGTLISGE